MKKQIVKTIQSLSGKYNPHTIFSDWVAMTAIGIQNGCQLIHNNLWQQREQQYLSYAGKYTSEELKKFTHMCGMLSLTMEQEEITDLLGEIYMESGAGNKQTGQFFTPFHLSELCAELAIPKDVSEENPYMINEPSTGGGGMILAAAKVLKDRGLNYQRCMEVVAQDLDWNGVYMTYTQLSLLGISATVVQGNTLSDPYIKGQYPPECVFYTPKKMGVLL